MTFDAPKINCRKCAKLKALVTLVIWSRSPCRPFINRTSVRLPSALMNMALKRVSEKAESERVSEGVSWRKSCQELESSSSPHFSQSLHESMVKIFIFTKCPKRRNEKCGSINFPYFLKPRPFHPLAEFPFTERLVCGDTPPPSNGGNAPEMKWIAAKLAGQKKSPVPHG